MTSLELQEEEVEVLKSIYDGDDCFKQVDETTYQYKVGEDGNFKSFLVEVKWGEDYPEELPSINMNLFYNKHIIDDVKELVIAKLTEEAEPFIGCAMTYSLFEFAKENWDELTASQPEAPVQTQQDRLENKNVSTDEKSKPKAKKEQLTKSQKRKLYSRVDLQTGEMPRGFDWVDVVKHLSQTGGITLNS